MNTKLRNIKNYQKMKIYLKKFMVPLPLQFMGIVK